MSTKLKVTVIASSLAILLFTVVGGFVKVRASSNEGAYRQLSVYSEVLSRIRSEYVEEPNLPESPTVPCMVCWSRSTPTPATCRPRNTSATRP